MKKIIALLVVFLLVFSLFSCNKGEKPIEEKPKEEENNPTGNVDEPGGNESEEDETDPSKITKTDLEKMLEKSIEGFDKKSYMIKFDMQSGTSTFSSTIEYENGVMRYVESNEYYFEENGNYYRGQYNAYDHFIAERISSELSANETGMTKKPDFSELLADFEKIEFSNYSKKNGNLTISLEDKCLVIENGVLKSISIVGKSILGSLNLSYEYSKFGDVKVNRPEIFGYKLNATYCDMIKEKLHKCGVQAKVFDTNFTIVQFFNNNFGAEMYEITNEEGYGFIYDDPATHDKKMVSGQTGKITSGSDIFETIYEAVIKYTETALDRARDTETSLDGNGKITFTEIGVEGEVIIKSESSLEVNVTKDGETNNYVVEFGVNVHLDSPYLPKK